MLRAPIYTALRWGFRSFITGLYPDLDPHEGLIKLILSADKKRQNNLSQVFQITIPPGRNKGDHAESIKKCTYKAFFVDVFHSCGGRFSHGAFAISS